MSILDDIGADIWDAFGNDPDSAFRPALFAKGRKRQSAFGPHDPVAAVDEEPCRAFVSRYNRKLATELGIPGTNVKILMLQRNDLGNRLVPENGDVVTTTEGIAGTWRIVDVSQDPAGATWTLQGEPI